MLHRSLFHLMLLHLSLQVYLYHTQHPISIWNIRPRMYHDKDQNRNIGILQRDRYNCKRVHFHYSDLRNHHHSQAQLKLNSGIFLPQNLLNKDNHLFIIDDAVVARVFPVLLCYWAILIFIVWYPVTEWHIIGKIWWFANIPHHNWVDNHLIYRSIGSSDWQFYWTGITKIRIYLRYSIWYSWIIFTEPDQKCPRSTSLRWVFQN